MSNNYTAYNAIYFTPQTKTIGKKIISEALKLGLDAGTLTTLFGAPVNYSTNTNINLGDVIILVESLETFNKTVASVLQNFPQYAANIKFDTFVVDHY
jgi:hypothetical protein